MTGISIGGPLEVAVARVEAPRPPLQSSKDERVSGATSSVATEKAVSSGAESSTQRAVERVREVLNAAGANIPANSKLTIRVDSDARRYVYEFRDSVTGEVKAQYPDKEVLAALAASNQTSVGVAVDQSA